MKKPSGRPPFTHPAASQATLRAALPHATQRPNSFCNHLREGGKARAGQEIKGRVRMVMQGGLERLVDEMLDEAAEAEEARRARVEQERAAAEQERQRRAAEGLPATDGDGAGRGAKAGPDHDARLLAVVLSLANSGYLSKACARFSRTRRSGASRRWSTTGTGATSPWSSLRTALRDRGLLLVARGARRVPRAGNGRGTRPGGRRSVSWR